jgi:hypothetical protein
VDCPLAATGAHEKAEKFGFQESNPGVAAYETDALTAAPLVRAASPASTHAVPNFGDRAPVVQRGQTVDCPLAATGAHEKAQKFGFRESNRGVAAHETDALTAAPMVRAVAPASTHAVPNFGDRAPVVQRGQTVDCPLAATGAFKTTQKFGFRESNP